MFYVHEKRPLNEFEETNNRREKLLVYGVQYKNGYPFFTVYQNGQWITRSAKHYEPVRYYNAF